MTRPFLRRTSPPRRPLQPSIPRRLIVLRDQPSASIAYNAGLDATRRGSASSRIRMSTCRSGGKDCLPSMSHGSIGSIRTGRSPAFSGWIAMAPLSAGSGPPASAGNSGRSRTRSLSSLWTSLSSCSTVTAVPVRSGASQLSPLRHRYRPDGTVVGKGAYVVDAPVVHNSVPTPGLRGGYMRAYDYMRRKWRARLPITTPVTRITRLGWYLRLQDMRTFRFNARRMRRIRAATAAPRPDPQGIARKMGYE